MLRAFICLPLPPNLQRRLQECQCEIEKQLPQPFVRWTPADQIHLTLRFLGSIPEHAVEDLRAALHRAGEQAPEFDLRLGGLGCFPDTKRPRVLWVGVEGALDQLYPLQESIATETARWGEREDRPFHPHLTLGRIKELRRGETRSLSETMARPFPFPVESWRASRVDLMRSELSAQGASHSCLAAVALAPRL